jgi:tetratricopeptide (TPR) repeat protein
MPLDAVPLAAVPRDDYAPQVLPEPLSSRERLEALGAKFKLDGQNRILSIDFSGTAASDVEVQLLSEFPTLKIVSLRGTAITDSGLLGLNLLPELELLILGDTAISDAGLSHLLPLSKLRFLALDDTQVSDAGFLLLLELPSLEGVSIQRAQVTAEAVQKFRQERPKCRVMTLDAPAPQEQLPTTGRSSPRQSTSPVQNALGGNVDLRQQLGARLRDPELLLTLGSQLISQGRFSEAQAILLMAHASAPGDERIQYELGIALAQSGEFERAYRFLEQVVGSANAYHDLGILCLEQGENYRAEAYFSRAIDIDPGHLASHEWLTTLRRQPVIPEPIVLPRLSERELLSLLRSTLDPTVAGPEKQQPDDPGIQIIPAAGGRQQVDSETP